MRALCAVLASFPILVSLVLPESAKAQEDCMGALKQDVIVLDRHNIVDLSVLDKKLDRAEEDDKSGIFASYGDYEFDFDRSQRVVKNLETLLDVDYTEEERELIRSTTLPRNAVDAYLECLNSKRGIEIPAAISAGAINSDSFFLTFYWRNRERPEEKSSTAKLMISQGLFRDSNNFDLEVPVEDREGKTVRVVRDRFQSTEISIEIPGADPTVIMVPKVPSMRIVTKPIEGDAFAYSANDSSGTFGRDLCVMAPAGTILVPGSFKLAYSYKAAAKVAYTEGPIEQGPFRACQSFQGSWGSPFSSYANVSLKAVAEVLSSEPIPAANQTIQQPLEANKETAPAPQDRN